MADPETVTLHGRDSETKDGVAAAAVTPGELVEYAGVTADGERQLQPHSTAGAAAMPRFATEYSHTGGSIDHDYAADDHMEYRPCMKGDEVYAFLAAGESVSVGDELVSDGAGSLRLIDTAGGDDPSAAVAEAVEAVDNSGGSDPVRLRAEVR